MNSWEIDISEFWRGQISNPRGEFVRSKGFPGDMSSTMSINLLSPDYVTAGKKATALTNGTQAGVVTTLIRGILKGTISGTIYGVGGAKLYKFSGSVVTSDATWPHTIDKAAVTAEDGEDVVVYQGNLYYSYNHSGTAGDIGKYDLSATFDDDWGSTVPSGFAALQGGVPHQMIVGGNDVMYITNGRYIASYDGTTFLPTALDLPTGSVVQSILWTQDRLWIFARGQLTKASSVYVWDGTTQTWLMEIPVLGQIGGGILLHGQIFFTYLGASTGTTQLARVNGETIETIKDTDNASGPAPYYSISTYYDHIIFNIFSSSIIAIGPFNGTIPTRMFYMGKSTHNSVGGLVGGVATKVMVASNATTNYDLAVLDNYSTDGYFYTTLFDITGRGKHSYIDAVRFNYYSMGTGDSLYWILYNGEDEILYSDTVSHAKAIASPSLCGGTSTLYNLGGKVADDFYLYVSFNGADAVQLRNIKVYGRTD